MRERKRGVWNGWRGWIKKEGGNDVIIFYLQNISKVVVGKKGRKDTSSRREVVKLFEY